MTLKKTVMSKALRLQTGGFMNLKLFSVMLLMAMAATAQLFAAEPVTKNAVPAKPERQSYSELQTVDLTRTPVDLPLPADAEKRRAAFEHRNDPEQVEALAKQLFALWDAGERKSCREEIGRRLEPLKVTAYKLYQEKNWPGALDAFRAYFFAKIRLIFKDEKGLTSSGYERRFATDLARRNYEDTLTLLMDNVYQVQASKETVRIGAPGLVRWNWQPSGPRLWENLRAPEFEYFCFGSSPFDRLWWKFTDTRDQKYLDKYLAFLDDYTMNHTLQLDLSAANLDLGKQGVGNAFNYIYSLSEIARVLPPDGTGYSSVSLARIVLRLLTVDIPQSVYYNREQSGNHSTGAIHNQLNLADYFWDFSIARLMIRESRRQFETYGTLFERPDGSMPGKNLGYAFHELRENMIFFNAVIDYGFDWFTPQLRREYVDRLVRRGRYLLNLYSPNGEVVQVYKASRINSAFDATATWFNRQLPQVWDDPALEAISTRIIHNQLSPDFRGTVLIPRNRPIAIEGMGVASGAEPPYTSLSFPYTGTHLMRNGWNPAESTYGVFTESRDHGDAGGLFKDAKCCNTLQIGAFGQDFFNNGVGYAYNFLLSPVMVDGLNQFAINGKSTHSRKAENNDGLTAITPYRVHHGARFDVAEGLYDGAWADTIDHDPPFYDFKYRLEVQKRAVTGITHRRVVQFIKEYGIWVVLDIMRDEANKTSNTEHPSSPEGYAGHSPTSNIEGNSKLITDNRSLITGSRRLPADHTYTQQQFMPFFQPKSPDGYREDQFVVDQNQHMLKSTAPDKPNLVMYYAGPAAAALEIMPVQKKERPADPYNFYRADRHDEYEFLHVRSRWKANGDSLLVTVMQGVRSDGKGETITAFTSDTEGFHAKLASGAYVDFSAKLSADKNNSAGFSSTLEVTDSGGKTHGVMLGAESFEFSGKAAAPAERSPVRVPIRELEILPAQNVFLDSLDVTVSCAEREIEIRYTLDGLDPTLESPRYSGPVRLTGSALFKARAFQAGLKAMPADQTSGVLMGRVHTAVFTREEPLAADSVAEGKLKPGLAFKYFQGKWPLLLFGAPTLKSVKTGEAAGVFDLTANAGNAGAFGFLYEGYLRVPEDGVYTIHAPDEFMKYRPLAGYDLSISLGRQATWANGVMKTGADLNEWYPATRRHAFGDWSVALKKGLHPLRVYYADFRPGAVLEYMQFTYPGLNVPGLSKVIFDGPVPQLEISGPKIKRQAIPKEWLEH